MFGLVKVQNLHFKAKVLDQSRRLNLHFAPTNIITHHQFQDKSEVESHYKILVLT